jgi:DNA helicase-2/ATP-dependent DNA helicase PcrA
VLYKTLGKYEIIDWLGGGRFGDVFRARDTLLDKEFALKVSRMRKQEIRMLKDEARLLASLDHPNIVRFYNIDFIEEKLVLIMEYIKGTTLRELIIDTGVDSDLCVRIIAHVLSALVYAHENKVLHRDLKPENILITEREGEHVVKVTDFGLARFIKSGSISASTAGTPIYMAPEVWSGNFDEKSDVWSIGVILYEMLTGSPPFLADDLNALKSKIDSGTFLAPTILRPHIPEDIEDAVVKCLNVQPQARPTARALLQMLTAKRAAVRAERFSLPQKQTAVVTLTATQRDAVENTDGQVLVLGQSGCGKTTTLTYAVARLIDKGIPPSKILVCTFTNKAAHDIKERLAKLTRFSEYDLWINTFHTLGLRILRRDVERLDMSEEFSIEEPKKIINDMNIKPGTYRLNAIIRFIEILKARGIAPEAFAPQNAWENFCHDVYKKYQAYLKEKNMLDYDDLILQAVTLLTSHEDIRATYRSHFDYLFVDELQDINPAQYSLIKLLFKKYVFLTGDEDQAIYGWRGAEREIMFQAPKDFSNMKTFYLSKSFRLPQDILEVANNLMLRPATALPADESGDIMVYAAKSEKDEAEYIVREIQSLRKQGFRYQDMAILYRMKYISRIYEDALIKARVPHTLISGTSFHNRSDIKPLLEYIALLDEFSKHATGSEAADDFIVRSLSLLNVKRRSTRRASELFKHHLTNATALNPHAVIDDVVNAFGLEGENSSELLSLARSYTEGDFMRLLNDIRLIQELDLADWGKDTVKLMTVHSAKGLEFPVVFVADLIEDVFPLTKKMVSKKETEEERRLCYVAVTRAKQKVYLLYPKWRHGRYQKPSRFLVDMFKTDM